MNALRSLRDDGPLARLAAARLVGRSGRGPLAWLVVPLVRALEYGGLIAITAVAEPDALPACFGLLGALAFHHYDAVYRANAGRPPPPRWVDAAGGGWEVRLVTAGIVAALGVLELVLVVAAAALGALWVAESALSWARAGRAGREGPARADAEALE